MQKITPSSQFESIKRLTDQTVISPSEHLDPNALALKKRVSKTWENNEEFIERLYPEKIRDLFRSSNIPISKLPILDLTKHPGLDAYIKLQIQDMVQPIMRFKDEWGRPGIAFHIEGYKDGNVNVVNDLTFPIRKISGVLTVFKRYTDQETRWKVSMNEMLDNTMLKLHNNMHNANGHQGSPTIECPDCPKGMNSGDDFSLKTLANLLNGQDPFFKIAQGYTPVAPPSLQAGAKEEEKKMAPEKK